MDWKTRAYKLNERNLWISIAQLLHNFPLFLLCFPTFSPAAVAYPVLMENIPVIGANIGTCAHRMPLTAPSKRAESTLLRWGFQTTFQKCLLSLDISLTLVFHLKLYFISFSYHDHIIDAFTFFSMTSNFYLQKLTYSSDWSYQCARRWCIPYVYVCMLIFTVYAFAESCTCFGASWNVSDGTFWCFSFAVCIDTMTAVVLILFQFVSS